MKHLADNRDSLNDNESKSIDEMFDFLKENDPDTLKSLMKYFLRRAGLPFRDFDKSKEEYFSRLGQYSKERIDFEDAIVKACEDYIEDIDPEEYDRRERNRRNAMMMMGFFESKRHKRNH